jgi:hypothetical protein
MSSHSDLNPEQLRELAWLRHEHRCALSITHDAEERAHLDRLVRGLTAYIQRLQRVGIAH